MKKIIFIGLLLYSLALFAQEPIEYSIKTRNWSSQGTDDGSIHPIGNGEMLVYEQGPDIVRLFGPPYSSPSYLEMKMDVKTGILRVESRREKNTAIWHHTVFREEILIARMADYMLPDKSIFFRDVEVMEEFNLMVSVPDEINAYSMGNYFSYIPGSQTSSVLFSIPMGTTFFVRNPIPEELSMIITATGCISISDSGNKKFIVNFKPGKGRLIFSSSNNYPRTVQFTEEILKDPGKDWIGSSRKFWKDFSSRRLNFGSKIPSDHPLRNEMLDAIDGVSVLIKCQQSTSGGVMAGHKYNMAYVRDMSGVLRGLLALGYIPEAKAILDFWLYKYNLFGNVLCADGMGNDAARLPLTNDEVEVPAYLIQNCFLYYKQTNDHEFLMKAFPMMEWAFEIQLPHLVEGMTEFSGDETYIAGSTFRGDLYQGSAESTLLFITGGEKLLDFAARNGLWKGEKLESYHQKVAYAKEKYKSNFIESGVFYANNPSREKLASLPRFRIGFCALHSQDQKTPLITWTERDDKGRYVCPDCRKKIVPERLNDPEKRYFLNSVSLVPLYLESNLFSLTEIAEIIKPGVELFRTKGTIPSNLEGIRSLGYDYGLFLYNMVKLNNPLKEQSLKKMLGILDAASAWGEYYDNDKPYNCRTRPWESAINIEALIEYINNGN